MSHKEGWMFILEMLKLRKGFCCLKMTVVLSCLAWSVGKQAVKLGRFSSRFMNEEPGVNDRNTEAPGHELVWHRLLAEVGSADRSSSASCVRSRVPSSEPS